MVLAGLFQQVAFRYAIAKALAVEYRRRRWQVGFGRVGEKSVKANEFMVAGWRGGPWNWGVRVLKEGRDIFQRHQRRLDQEDIVVVLQGAPEQQLRKRLKPSFWKDCPEVRDAEIGKWMRSRGDAPWPSRKPPKYCASLTVGEEIVLRLG